MIRSAADIVACGLAEVLKAAGVTGPICLRPGACPGARVGCSSSPDEFKNSSLELDDEDGDGGAFWGETAAGGVFVFDSDLDRDLVDRVLGDDRR